jgi:hypothetical protein
MASVVHLHHGISETAIFSFLKYFELFEEIDLDATFLGQW